MSTRDPGWIKEIAFDKAKLFLKVLNLYWESTEKLANGIYGVLLEYAIKSGSILDLCCGNGRLSVHLAKKGFNVTGVDISRPFIYDARKKAKENEVSDLTTFIECDVKNLKSIRRRGVEPFDVIISAGTSIGYYDNETDGSIFKQARELSKDDAILLVADTTHQAHAMATPLYRRSPWINLDDETVVLKYSVFDPKLSREESTWSFYQRRGEDLLFLDRAKFDYHVYTFSELSNLLQTAGWEVEAYYGNLSTRENLTPQTSMNIIAKAI